MSGLLFHGNCCCCFQGSCPRVSTKEEGICQMPWKSRGRARKSKQDSDWGAQSLKRHLQTQSRVIPLIAHAVLGCFCGVSWGLRSCLNRHINTHSHKTLPVLAVKCVYTMTSTFLALKYPMCHHQQKQEPSFRSGYQWVLQVTRVPLNRAAARRCRVRENEYVDQMKTRIAALEAENPWLMAALQHGKKSLF